MFSSFVTLGQPCSGGDAGSSSDPSQTASVALETALCLSTPNLLKLLCIHMYFLFKCFISNETGGQQIPSIQWNQGQPCLSLVPSLVSACRWCPPPQHAVLGQPAGNRTPSFQLQQVAALRLDVVRHDNDVRTQPLVFIAAPMCFQRGVITSEFIRSEQSQWKANCSGCSAAQHSAPSAACRRG